MGQAKRDCPHCPRPNGIHADKCPRSRVSRAKIDGAMSEASHPRTVYPGKGTFFTKDEGVGVNPGMPFSKSPGSGGVKKGRESAGHRFLKRWGKILGQKKGKGG